MNKTAIKNFAIWARNKLIADVSYDARLIGITEDGIAKPLPQSFGGTQFFDIGTAEPYSISGEAVRQRDKLIEVIQQKEKDTDYKTAYQYVIEEVAYTWFNRLIAIRFMEVNDYLPSHIRVLSSESGKLEPDLVTTPFDAELPFTAEEAAKTQLGSREANEARKSSKKWYPCNKGGSYRKWYGNNVYIADWENDGQAMRSYKGSVIRNPQFYFRQGITWSSLANQLSLRYSPEGFIFESKGSMCYPIRNDNLNYLLGLLNCKVTSEALAVLSPTLDFHEGPMAKVPVLDAGENTVHVNELVENCVGVSKDDWDSFENSWDFKKHPLLRNVSTISEAFTQWQTECDDRFNQLKANEEELNRIFIDIYGLHCRTL